MTEQNPNPEVENKVDLNSAPKPNQMSEIKIASLSLNMGSGKDEAKLKKCLKLLKTITRMTPLKTLAKKSPLFTAALDMVIKHLPNPVEAQKYRSQHIWHGDLSSNEGKSMVE